MKTVSFTKTVNRAQLAAELSTALGADLLTCRLSGGDVTNATSGEVVVNDSVADAAVQAVIDAHDAAASAIAGHKAVSVAEFNDAAKRVGRAIALVAMDELNPVGITTQAWDPASIANGAGLTSPNATVQGATFGDVVDVAAPYDLQGLLATGYISAANTVRVRLHNATGVAINLANGTWTVIVRRPKVRTAEQAKSAVINRIGTTDAD